MLNVQIRLDAAVPEHIRRRLNLHDSRSRDRGLDHGYDDAGVNVRVHNLALHGRIQSVHGSVH